MNLLGLDLARMQPPFDDFAVHAVVRRAGFTFAIFVAEVPSFTSFAPAITLEAHKNRRIRTVQGNKLVTARVERNAGEGGGVPSAKGLVGLALTSGSAEGGALGT